MYEEKKFKSTRRTLKSLHQTHSFVLVGILAFYDEVGTCDEQMSQSKLVQRQELKSGPSIFSPGAFLLYYPIFTLYIVIYNIICLFFLNLLKCPSDNIFSNRISSMHFGCSFHFET